MILKDKILIVDDDPALAEVFRFILEKDFNVSVVHSVGECIRVARSEGPALILLDVCIPAKEDGIMACETLRNTPETRDIPVVMISGAGDLDVRIEAFENGADDFILKPVSRQELLARIHSKIRRVREASKVERRVECGNLKLDVETLEVKVDGAEVRLSVLEFDLLRCFLKNQNCVLSRDRILKSVWRDTVVSGRTVDAHIVGLRRKLNGFDHEFVTVYGSGYVLKRRAEKTEPRPIPTLGAASPVSNSI